MILRIPPQNCGQIPENTAKTYSVNAKGSFQIQSQLGITDCDFKHLNKNIAKKLCFYLAVYSKNAIFVSS